MAYRKSDNQRNVPRGETRYQFYLRYKGETYRKNVITRSSRVETTHHEWISKVKHLGDVDNISLFAALNLYMEHVEKAKSQKAYRDEQRVIKRVRDFFSIDIPLDQVRRYHMEDFISYCREHPWDGRTGPLKDVTINRYVAVLSTFFTFCITRELYSRHNPCFKVKLKTDTTRDVRLSREQLEELLTKAEEYSDHVYTAVLLAIFAGLRREEVTTLNWDDVDFERGYIHIRGEVSKTGKPRSIPMPDLLADKLSERKRLDPFSLQVFPWKTTSGLYQQWKRLRQRLNCKDLPGGLTLRFHDLRHVYGQSLRDVGILLQDVQAFMGHSSVSVTEKHYAQRGGLNGREKVNKLANVVPLKKKSG